MPRIVDYDRVTEQLTAQGLVCLYYNSGAFGFDRSVPTRAVGWIGPPDPTIRPAALAFTRTVPPPYEATLASLAQRVWREQLPGDVWVLPKSHWHFELEFGSRAWMPGLLERIGIRPIDLEQRNNGAALEFGPEEAEPFRAFVQGLLENLAQSDFNLAWPGRVVVCTVHHHKQLWWMTTDKNLASSLEAITGPAGSDLSVNPLS